MLASTARLASGSAHGSLSMLAAPVPSPVNASVKRASQAPCTTAAPARSASASLPRAVVREHSTSRSPDFYGSVPSDVIAFLKANHAGMSHALLLIDNTAWESGNKNIPPVLMRCFLDISALTVEGSAAKSFSVKLSPSMCVDSETKMRIKVVTHVECKGSCQLVECADMTVWVRKDGYVEFRAKDMHKCLKKVGAAPGDWLLVSLRREGDQLVMELRVMREEAVTEAVLAAMQRFLVVKPVARKPRGQKAKQVVVAAAGPKQAASRAAAYDQQQEEEEEEAAALTAAAPCAAPRATRKRQQKKAKQGAKPTAAPAPSAAAKATANLPAVNGSVGLSPVACSPGSYQEFHQNILNTNNGPVTQYIEKAFYGPYYGSFPQHASGEGSATCCCGRYCCCGQRS